MTHHHNHPAGDQKKRLTVGDRLRKLGKDLAKLPKSDKASSAWPSAATGAPNPLSETNVSTTFGQQEPEPEVLARQIQHLVNSLPLPHSPTPASSPIPLSPYPFDIPLPPTTDDSLNNEPQNPQPQLKDSRFLALLSNASFMNGSSLKGIPSIWSVLENIHRTGPNKEDEPPPPPPPPSNTILNESSQNIMTFSDTSSSSIMVYSPLFPTPSDIVELAELVPFDGAEEMEIQAEHDADKVASLSELESGIGNDVGVSNIQEAQGGGGPGTSWSAVWPFSIWYRPDQTGSGVSQTPSLMSVVVAASASFEPLITSPPQVGTSNSSPAPPTTTNQHIRPIKSQKNMRAWVPSSSKISVQAFWWGYRLYLPPPILEILSDKTLEATKRSAVITTALTWFFNNLPIDVFPPPMKPALFLLQRLVPLLGYIGTFISWSWNTIRSYDVGCGVTLTATWILPVALIPGTWYERDFPKSPTPYSPIPLPPCPLSISSSSSSFVSPTPTTPTPTTTDLDSSPMSVYATPLLSLSSMTVLGSPPPQLFPDVGGGTGGLNSSLASSSSSSSPLLLPLPPLQSSQSPPTSFPIHYPTTIHPNSPSSLCFTPNSPTPPPPSTPSQLATPTSLPVPRRLLSLHSSTSTSTTTIPSPRIRTPRFSTTTTNRMRASSPSITAGSAFSPPPLIIIQNIIPSSSSSSSPTPIPTPIPMPPTPIELAPIPPPEEFLLNPTLVNQLLRGPVLQTIPLPDVG